MQLQGSQVVCTTWVPERPRVEIRGSCFNYRQVEEEAGISPSCG